jgi:predicted nucleotidyltransferase
MTLQIKGVQIAGIPAVAIRNLLRGVNQVLYASYVADRCNVSARRAKEIIEGLVADGYLEFAERSRELTAPYRLNKDKPRYRYVDLYKLTAKGIKLCQASAIAKMPRAKAERIIAGLLRRVEEVNGVVEYLFRIPTVIVYGSYVRGEVLLSDVDIAVDLEAKWDPATTSREEFVALTNKRVDAACAKGRTFSSFFEQLEWPSREVMLHLKGRTRGLSLHLLNDFVRMEKDDNFAYRVLIGDANKIAEQLARRAAQLRAQSDSERSGPKNVSSLFGDILETRKECSETVHPQNVHGPAGLLSTADQDSRS